MNLIRIEERACNNPAQCGTTNEIIDRNSDATECEIFAVGVDNREGIGFRVLSVLLGRLMPEVITSTIIFKIGVVGDENAAVASS